MFMRSLTCGLAVVLFYSNVLVPPLAQASFWAERRRVVEAHHVRSSQPAHPAAPLLAELPPLCPPLSTLSTDPRNPYQGKGEGASPLAAWVQQVAAPYGIVREAWLPSNRPRRLILHIQDAHEYQEVQQHIAGLIEAFSSHGLRVVGLEAAKGVVNFAPYRGFPDPQVTQDLAAQFLQWQWLSGPEYAGLTMRHPPLFVGLEDAALYRAHVFAYRAAYTAQQSLTPAYQRWRGLVQGLKDRYYPRPLQDLDVAIAKYHQGSFPLTEYVKVLIPDPRALPAAPYPQLHRFMEALAVEQSWHIPQFDRDIHYTLLVNQIQHEPLVAELERLEEERVGTWLTTPTLRAVHAASQDLSLLGKLLTQTLTSQEWKRYAQRRAEILAFPERLTILAKRLHEPSPHPVEGSAWSELLTRCEGFYRLAIQRNEALVRHLQDAWQTLPSPGASPDPMPRTAPELAIVVAGGFHTDGLTQRWKHRGFPYVVITPRITKRDDSRDPLEVFRREKTPLEQLFREDRMTLAVQGAITHIPELEELPHREPGRGGFKLYLIGFCASASRKVPPQMRTAVAKMANGLGLTLGGFWPGPERTEVSAIGSLSNPNLYLLLIVARRPLPESLKPRLISPPRTAHLNGKNVTVAALTPTMARTNWLLVQPPFLQELAAAWLSRADLQILMMMTLGLFVLVTGVIAATFAFQVHWMRVLPPLRKSLRHHRQTVQTVVNTMIERRRIPPLDTLRTELLRSIPTSRELLANIRGSLTALASESVNWRSPSSQALRPAKTILQLAIGVDQLAATGDASIFDDSQFVGWMDHFVQPDDASIAVDPRASSGIPTEKVFSITRDLGEALSSEYASLRGMTRFTIVDPSGFPKAKSSRGFHQVPHPHGYTALRYDFSEALQQAIIAIGLRTLDAPSLDQRQRGLEVATRWSPWMAIPMSRKGLEDEEPAIRKASITALAAQRTRQAQREAQMVLAQAAVYSPHADVQEGASMSLRYAPPYAIEELVTSAQQRLVAIKPPWDIVLYNQAERKLKEATTELHRHDIPEALTALREVEKLLREGETVPEHLKKGSPPLQAAGEPSQPAGTSHVPSSLKETPRPVVLREHLQRLLGVTRREQILPLLKGSLEDRLAQVPHLTDSQAIKDAIIYVMRFGLQDRQHPEAFPLTFLAAKLIHRLGVLDPTALKLLENALQPAIAVITVQGLSPEQSTQATALLTREPFPGLKLRDRKVPNDERQAYDYSLEFRWQAAVQEAPPPAQNTAEMRPPGKEQGMAHLIAVVKTSEVVRWWFSLPLGTQVFLGVAVTLTLIFLMYHRRISQLLLTEANTLLKRRSRALGLAAVSLLLLMSLGVTDLSAWVNAALGTASKQKLAPQGSASTTPESRQAAGRRQGKTQGPPSQRERNTLIQLLQERGIRLPEWDKGIASLPSFFPTKSRLVFEKHATRLRKRLVTLDQRALPGTPHPTPLVIPGFGRSPIPSALLFHPVMLHGKRIRVYQLSDRQFARYFPDLLKRLGDQGRALRRSGIQSSRVLAIAEYLLYADVTLDQLRRVDSRVLTRLRVRPDAKFTPYLDELLAKAIYPPPALPQTDPAAPLSDPAIEEEDDDPFGEPSRALNGWATNPFLFLAVKEAMDESRRPLLTLTQQQRLADLVQRGNPSALTTFAEPNMRLVAFWAERYIKYVKRPQPPDSFNELFQKGSLGLMTGIQRFNPDLGWKFGTFGSWWIKKDIIRFLQWETSTIQIPGETRKSLSQFMEALERGRLTPSATAEEVVAQIGDSLDRARTVLAVYTGRYTSPVSLEALPRGGAGIAQPASQREGEPSLRAPLGNADVLKRLERAFEQSRPPIPEWKRAIFLAWLNLEGDERKTLEAVGDEFHLTKERIRQITEEVKRALRPYFADHARRNGRRTTPAHAVVEPELALFGLPTLWMDVLLSLLGAGILFSLTIAWIRQMGRGTPTTRHSQDPRFTSSLESRLKSLTLLRHAT